MKTTATVSDLAGLSDDEFVELVQAYPQGKDWESADAFRYAATRLARMQGLNPRQRMTIECQGQKVARPDGQTKLY